MSRCLVIRFRNTAIKLRSDDWCRRICACVVGYAKRFRHFGVPLLDLIHEGNLGLIEAARRFNPAQGSDFQTASLWWIRQAMMHLLSDSGGAVDPSASGLLAAPVQGRQVEAIRVAIEYAQSAAAGQEIKEPPVADAEDFAAHLREAGRRKSIRKARKRRSSTPASCRYCSSTAFFAVI